MTGRSAGFESRKRIFDRAAWHQELLFIFIMYLQLPIMQEIFI
jgi:hypothetical protein